MQQAVHQFEREGLLRGEDATGVGGAVERRVGELARLRDLPDDPVPDAFDEQRGLFAGRFTHVVAEEGFHGRLVFADLGDLDADPERLQGFAEIHVGRGQSLQFDLARRVHRDVVRDAGEVVLRLRPILEPSHDGLAGLLAVLGDGLAEFAQLDDPGLDFAGDDDTGDIPVLGGEFERGEGAVQVDGGALLLAEQGA